MDYFNRRLLAASTFAAIALGAATAQADMQADAPPAMQAGINAWDRGDFEGAVRAWRPLADKGDADAQFNIGQAYRQGKGVPANPETALGWYRKAADQGHPQAAVNVGLLLYNSGRKADSLDWLRKGADLGDPRAQYVLGTEMFNGQLVAKDWPRAYALMTLAAGRGLGAAQQNLKAMDEYVPADQRQQGLAIAKRLESGSEKLGAPGVSFASAAPEAVPPSRPARAPAPTRAPAPIKAEPVRVASAKPVPAPAKPAPAPAKAAPAPARAAGGGWRVQLGAFGDAGNAQKQWASIKGKASGFGGLAPYMVKAGAVTRLQAGPLASREAAEKLCAAAKAAGSGCIPVAP